MRKALQTTLALLLLCTAAFRPASAQDVSAREAARALLRPDVREKVVLTDTVSEFRTRPVPGGRMDVEEGIYRARYRIRDAVPARISPRDAALEHISRSARAYGVTRTGKNLTVESVRESRYASHIRFRQVLEGVPVYGRELKVNLDTRGQPTMVINGYAPHLETLDEFDPTPRLSGSQAVRIVQTASTRGLNTSEPELVVYPSKPPLLAWKVDATMDALSVAYEVLVDARSGEIIRMLDVSLHADGMVDLSDLPTGGGPDRLIETEHVPASGAGASLMQRHSAGGNESSSNRRVDGTGWVFDPDPLSSAGAQYGGDFVDNNDADNDALFQQLFTVPLRDISQGSDGLYRLEGPYVTIVGTPTGYEPPKEASPHDFTYTRANDFFEAVMAYYHVDKSQRYVQTLDVGFPIKNEPIRVNPQGFTADESQFFPSDNLIRLGTGGVDDAEDADVIWHEYAHALLYFTAPQVPLSIDSEGRAYHEGWSDYWAASYSRHLSEEDDQIPQHDWRKVFNWDGNTSTWQGRRLDHTGSYPDDTEYVNDSGIGEAYQKGLLWATTLMDIYPQVGRSVLDRLNLASHAYLGRPFAFVDAAEALIQADYDLNAGAHSNVLVHYLSERGYIDEANYGPVLSHEPLPATEQTSGTVRIEVTAAATTAAVDSVLIFYGTGGETSSRLVLHPQGGDLYAADLPLPGGEATVRYYVVAVDIEGKRRSLPGGAPAETYSFDVGPDTEAPSIQHEPLAQISLVGWPADLYAAVDDNLGIDSVWVEYEVERAGGSTQEGGSFGLAFDGETYFGRFPSTASKIEEGGAVRYRIFARDKSQGGNVAVLPEDGSFRIPFVEEGVLRLYDFEGIGRGLSGTGEWLRGTPSYGLRIAHSGGNVWATTPSAAYSDTPELSSLSLPSFDLSEAGEAYLVFWHWYDFEHNGLAEPGVFKPLAGVWDGGNVKVSVDGGTTWNALEPQRGYNGTVSDQYGNPLGGEKAFGGYSYGWRREIIPLPEGGDVRVRFDFGTDDGNEHEARYYAGWHIDDVSITTSLPDDDSPPRAVAVPEMKTVRVPDGEGAPLITVEMHDDTGIEAVISEYEMTLAGDVQRGSTRLAMAESDLHVYTGAVAPHASFGAGDRIEYRLLVRDFDGNEVRVGEPFVIDYRAEQKAQALRDAVATGAWRRQGSSWAATNESETPVSSLILEPFTLPRNADSTEFVLEHSFSFGEGLAGNVKVSVDDGRHWDVLDPESGYPSTFQESHPMRGEGVFDDAGAARVSRFSLSAYAGSEIRVRLDFAQNRPPQPGESWIVSGASYRSLSPDPEIETERKLTLHSNFPDPVADRTTVTYTIPERMPVRLSVFDVLGRRVTVIRHAEHEAGTYTVRYDVQGLANGVYMLYLETTSGVRSEQMVVAR